MYNNRNGSFRYLYVLDDFGIKGVIVGVGWDFCCAVLEQIFLPGERKI